LALCTLQLQGHAGGPTEAADRSAQQGGTAFAMRFQSRRGAHAFEKDFYISPDLTLEKPNMVAKGRCVILYGGAFPPCTALVHKFKIVKGFDEAFALRVHEDEAPSAASRRKSRQPEEGFEVREFAWDLIQMGKDQQFSIPTLDSMVDKNGIPPVLQDE